jgi:hypothetical protein
VYRQLQVVDVGMGAELCGALTRRGVEPAGQPAPPTVNVGPKDWISNRWIERFLAITKALFGYLLFNWTSTQANQASS